MNNRKKYKPAAKTKQHENGDIWNMVEDLAISFLVMKQWFCETAFIKILKSYDGANIYLTFTVKSKYSTLSKMSKTWSTVINSSQKKVARQ